MLNYCFRELREDGYVRKEFPGVAVKADFGRTPKFTVVDVGCGTMPYAEGLWQWMSEQSRNPVLIGIDSKDYSHSFRNRPYVTFIQSEAKKARPLLWERGVTSIDLLTVFNPNPGLPLPNPAELAFWSLLLVAYPNDDYREKLPPLKSGGYHMELDMFWEGTQGEFEPLLALENPFHAELRGAFGYSFSPVLLALS